MFSLSLHTGVNVARVLFWSLLINARRRTGCFSGAKVLPLFIFCLIIFRDDLLNYFTVFLRSLSRQRS